MQVDPLTFVCVQAKRFKASYAGQRLVRSAFQSQKPIEPREAICVPLGFVPSHVYAHLYRYIGIHRDVEKYSLACPFPSIQTDYMFGHAFVGT